MKTQLKRLNKIFALTILSVSDFYSIGITESGIILQGHYNSDLVKRMKLKKSHFVITDNGYLSAHRKNIQIVLT